MKKQILLLAFLMAAFAAGAQDAARTEPAAGGGGFRKGYQKLMQRAFMDLAENIGISDTILVRLIPETAEEYGYFMDMSRHANDSLKALTTGWNKYTTLLDQKATAQDNRLYQKLMYMGEFVQGEFSEFYYNLTDRLVEKDKALFCTFYKRENSQKLMKLRRYAQGCK